jgi:hypothetical protein
MQPGPAAIGFTMHVLETTEFRLTLYGSLHTLASTPFLGVIHGDGRVQLKR